MRSVAFDFEPPAGTLELERRVERFPFVPSDRARRDERCDEVYRIQVQGLAQRLEATGIERVVLGISGGLDSTQALLVAAKTFDLLGRSRTRHPGLHHARARHQLAHPRERARADALPGRDRGRDRHLGGRARDARAHRTSLRARRGGLRRHLRERAGGGAHVAPVPARQSAWRSGGRHRRSVRARARLVHLRRRRPDVALQRERLGAQDADPAPGALVDRERARRCADRRRAAVDPRHRDLARAGAEIDGRPARRSSAPRT